MTKYCAPSSSFTENARIEAASISDILPSPMLLVKPTIPTGLAIIDGTNNDYSNRPKKKSIIKYSKST